MGRHSRRGPAPKGGSADKTAKRGGAGAEGASRPAPGFPRTPDGTPAHGFPRLPDGTPAHGFPRLPDGTPAQGTARYSGGGGPQARGGHPEQREPGGGWGDLGAQGGTGAPGPALPRQRRGRPPGGPRQDYLDAFESGALDEGDVFAPRTPRARGRYQARAVDPYGFPLDADPDGDGDGGGVPPAGAPAAAKGGKGRAFTGVAAAAVTTVLAVVVAGQVAAGRDDTTTLSQSAGQARDAGDQASRSDGRTTPSPSASAVTLTYAQQMDRKYPLAADLAGSGKFDAVKGVDKAPGTGRKYTYRVDVEQGLGLDAQLFADAVQKTLNDDRSWAHNGARTFERIHSGKPDFVITLASPGTTADWCAKSGLDTTVDNVSCDSAATDRVMINAYRWAQGSKTYGDKIHAYRQMLINHEVGHRLGYHHVTCDKSGDLAPVMQQQTKFLEYDGITCKANPWAYPGS
ncbi:DUF3152 domain-containing protein [Streptomyces sp. NPDC090106]|uniref:DUF3152 domain-containing protein n=1 Tax=Streptomyces sp. NPDC090106 TaxID=3365946 RepID=UPI0037FBB5CF